MKLVIVLLVVVLLLNIYALFGQKKRENYVVPVKPKRYCVFNSDIDKSTNTYHKKYNEIDKVSYATIESDGVCPDNMTKVGFQPGKCIQCTHLGPNNVTYTNLCQNVPGKDTLQVCTQEKKGTSDGTVYLQF